MENNTITLEDRAEMPFEAYRAASQKGFAVPEQTADAKAPEPAPADTKTADDKAEAPAESTEEQPEEPGIVHPDDPHGVKKRLSKVLEREQAAREEADRLRREVEALKSAKAEPPAPPVAQPAPTKPKLDDFDSIEEYTDALTDWKLEQRESQESARRKTNEIETMISAAESRYPDFRVVAFSPEVVATVQAAPFLGDAITASPVFADLAMHFGQNPQELKRIAALPAVRALAELGKIEDKIEAKAAPAAPKKAAPALPPPPEPVGGKTQTSSDPSLEDQSEMPYLEYKRFIMARRKA